MSDPRITPANDRVVLASRAAEFPHLKAVDGTLKSVTRPVANLMRKPDGPLDRQVLMGEAIQVLEERDGWAFVQLARDGYVGYLAADELGPAVDVNFMVAARSSHLYPRPDIKAPVLTDVSFGSRVRVVSETSGFFETDAGQFVPKPHLRGLGQPFRDYVTVAQLFFGTPYLWGGNSTSGIDCSGLVQAALIAAHLHCPGDSDLQEAALGLRLSPETPPERGDLFFWKGHVAIAVDPETLIHANAHHMAVAYEPIRAAIARIEAQGGGPVTSHRRLQALGASS